MNVINDTAGAGHDKNHLKPHQPGGNQSSCVKGNDAYCHD